MVKFIVHENQYSINKNDVKLKNFVTQIYASGHVSDLFCQFPTKIVTEFEIYRQNVYISRTSMVSDRINKFQLMPINHQDEKKSTDTKGKITEKESRRALKTLMIA